MMEFKLTIRDENGQLKDDGIVIEGKQNVIAAARADLDAVAVEMNKMTAHSCLYAAVYVKANSLVEYPYLIVVYKPTFQADAIEDLRKTQDYLNLWNTRLDDK